MIKKILTVDDSAIARKMLISCLPKEMGFNIYEAGNGKEGLEKYKELTPDIVFMDLTMPVMDGYQAIDEIIKVDKNALIIVVTADVQMKAIKKVMDSGAFMVLKKPLKKEDISAAFAKVQDSLQKVI